MGGHTHVRERGVLVPGPGGVPQPAPSPRLDRTPGKAGSAAPRDGEHTREVLRKAGFGPEQMDEWIRNGVVGDAD